MLTITNEILRVKWHNKDLKINRLPVLMTVNNLLSIASINVFLMFEAKEKQIGKRKSCFVSRLSYPNSKTDTIGEILGM